LPDTQVRLDLPLLGNPNLPINRDPYTMRSALKKIYLFSEITGESGYFKEEPSNAKTSRQSVTATVDTRPILLARNTLIRPSFVFYQAAYPSVKDHYSYQQFDLALEHIFDKTSAVSMEFLGTAQGGKDPFKFDTVDTSEELDLRAQTKLFNGAIGTHIKYDLLQHTVFNWQIGYSFLGGAIVPSITYQNPGGSIGIAINVPGLTFW
jgi:hypothetical protein